MSGKPVLDAGTPVLVNARTNRVVPYLPPAPGREPHPNRNHVLAHNADGWVRGMAEHYASVCPSHLWRVHGELYDFEKYMDLHPGGRIFLEQSRGSDCTEAFECHHVQGVPRVLMEKYKVKTDITTPLKSIPDRYEYKTNFAEIKKFVADYMKNQVKNPTGATPNWAGVLYIAVVVQFLLLARQAARRHSYPLAFVAGIALTGCWGVGHNQVHRGRKMSKYWNLLRYAMDLTGFSSHETTVTHAMSHHQNANTYYDIEIYNFQEIGLYFLTNEPKSSALPYRLGTFFLSSGLTAPFLYLARLIQRLIVERDFFNADVIVPTALIGMMAHEAKSLSKGIKLTFAIWAVFSAWFVPSSFALHHPCDMETGAPLCYHDGEPGMQRDFAAHQIVSTLDHSVDLNDYAALTLFAHLNVHTIHHMFPTIDRVYHVPLLKAMLKENPGNFRELYHIGNKVGRDFWTELLPSVYRLIRDRRFEPTKSIDH